VRSALRVGASARILHQNREMERHLARLSPVGSSLGEPSLSEAIDHVRDAGQRVLVDEIRLLVLEAQERLTAALRRAGWLGFGVFCLVLAWVGFLLAAVVALEAWMPLELRLAAAAASQLVLGLCLLGWGMRSRRQPR
jgi:hypothetical protein